MRERERESTRERLSESERCRMLMMLPQHWWCSGGRMLKDTLNSLASVSRQAAFWRKFISVAIFSVWTSNCCCSASALLFLWESWGCEWRNMTQRSCNNTHARDRMASFGKLTDYFNRRRSRDELMARRDGRRSGSYCCTVAEARYF